MKIKHRSGPDASKPNHVPGPEKVKHGFGQVGLTAYEKMGEIVAKEIASIHIDVCSNFQRLSFEECKKIAILGEEVRAMKKFEDSLDTADELAQMSNEELARSLLKAK